jgi:hypothetical protein
MRTSNGFDRISTPEELSQVLAILGESERTTLASLAEDEMLPVWWEDLSVDEGDAESLAELVNKPELKN